MFCQKYRLSTNILFYLLTATMLTSTSARAHIYFSGDAAIQPRLDVKTYQDKSVGAPTTQERFVDGYYLYRARINIKADVADHFYFQTQLSTNTLENWNKMGNDSPSYLASPKTHGSASTGPVDFQNLFIGYKKHKLSFNIGKLPLQGNLLLNTHYYPDHPLNLPYMIISNNAFTGAALSYANLKTFVSVDSITTPVYYEGPQPKDNVTVSDETSLGFNYKIEATKSLTFTPTTIVTLSSVDELEPQGTKGERQPFRLTAGMLMEQKISKTASMKLAGGYSFAQVSQNPDDFFREDHEKSNILVGHIGFSVKELGAGVFDTFAEFAQIKNYPWSTTEQRFQEAEFYSVAYLHAQYTVTLAKKDHRAVSIKPAFRYLLHNSAEDTNGYLRQTIKPGQKEKPNPYDWYNRIIGELTYSVKF